MDGVGKLQGSQSVFRVSNQLFSAQQVRCKSIQHAHMLWIFPVRLYFFLCDFCPVPGIIALKAGYSFVFSKAVTPDLIVFANQFPTFTVDLQPVGSGEIACGRNKHACGSVVKFQIGCYVVFHFNMVPFSFMTMRLNRHRHSAQPDQQVKLMRTLIQQNAAALTGPGSSPGTRIIVFLRPVPVGDNPAHALDGAQFFVFHHPSDCTVYAVCPLVEHQCQGLARSGRTTDHPFRGVRFHSSRFLAKHMNSMAQRLYGQLFVEVMRHRDQDRVASCLPDQIPSGRIDLHFLRQGLPRPLPTFLPQVCHRSQFNLRAFPARNIPAVLRSHIPDADHA